MDVTEKKTPKDFVTIFHVGVRKFNALSELSTRQVPMYLVINPKKCPLLFKS